MRCVELLTQKMITLNIIKDEDKNIYQYGIENGITILANIITSFLIGIFTKKLDLVLVFLLSFISLRTYAGGFHLEKKLTCYIYSNLILIVPLYGYEAYYQLFSNIYAFVLLCFIFLIITILSPVESRRRRYDSIEKKIFKKRSILILIVQSVIYLLLIQMGASRYAYIILVSLFVVAILLLIGKVTLWLEYR